MSSNKRGRDSNSESSDDDAPIVQLSAVATALHDAEWAKPYTALDDIVAGVTSFCTSMDLFCQARIRSSDKSRATITCKWQANGCPLRLTVKKPAGFVKYCTPNMHTFVMGTCIQAPPTHHQGTRRLSPAVNDDRVSPFPLNPVSGIPAPQNPVLSVAPPKNTTQCQDCPYDDSDECVITCAAGSHHYCKEHMDAFARFQVGEHKVVFLRTGCQFRCPLDDSIFDLQQVIAAVSKETWTLINSALQEQAVIDAQRELRAQVPGAKLSPHEEAMEAIRFRAQPRCNNCKDLLTDFEACSALTCGVVRGNVRASGCGARICAWCLKVLDASEQHHEHVANCRRNPDPGSVHPPLPHPQVWNTSMALLTRERIFCFIESQKGEHFRNALYAATRKEFPDIGMTEEWVTLRQKWMVITLDCSAQQEDVEHFDNCRNTLIEMGYADNELLMRAIIFCSADIAQITYALRAHETHA